MEYYQIIETVYNIIAPKVETLYFGDEVSQNVNWKNEKYTLAVFSINTATSDDNNLIYPVRLEVVDVVDYKKEHPTNKIFGNDNTQDVYNETMRICTYFVRKLNQKKIKLQGQANFTKLDDKKYRTKGWAVELDIIIHDETKIC